MLGAGQLMTRGGARARSGRKAIPDPRTPYEIRLSRAERAEIDEALDPGETFSEYGRNAMLAEARRRAAESGEET